MTAEPGAPTTSMPKASSGAAKLLVPFGIGAAVSVSLGVYGKLHEPAHSPPSCLRTSAWQPPLLRSVGWWS